MDSNAASGGQGPSEDTSTNVSTGSERAAGMWGHVLVAVSACVLTVSIVGSGVFLSYRIYSRQQLKARVRERVAGLENRTAQEIADFAAQLRQRPKAADYVLPELRRTLRGAPSERQMCAAIDFARYFIDDRKVETAIFDLRGDARESVSGAAVETLFKIQPPQRAAELLGRCLDGANAGQVSAAAIDSACVGLFELGAAGAVEMQKRLSVLTPARKTWLVGYVDSVGGPYRQMWLEWLAADGDTHVSNAARTALATSGAGRAALHSLESSSPDPGA